MNSSLDLEGRLNKETKNDKEMNLLPIKISELPCNLRDNLSSMTLPLVEKLEFLRLQSVPDLQM